MVPHVGNTVWKLELGFMYLGLSHLEPQRVLGIDGFRSFRFCGSRAFSEELAWHFLFFQSEHSPWDKARVIFTQ